MANPWVQNFLVFLIFLNAVILGLETDADIMNSMGPQLLFIDRAILWIFIAGVVVLITAIDHDLRIVHRELSELRQLLEKKTEQSPRLP